MNAPTPTGDRGVPAWAAVLLGALLGLALLKFGNPVILDAHVQPPASLAEVLSETWPPRWAFPLFACVAVAVAAFSPLTRLLLQDRTGRWVAGTALLWLGWQFIAGQRSVDPRLTQLTLPHFTAVVASFLLGWLVLSRCPRRNALFAGLGVAALACWLIAVRQHVFEFPQDHAMLSEGQQVGWTNFPATAVEEMRKSGMILRTNGVEIANPAILDKLQRGRAFGTLVYPNALAGSVLLLLAPLTALAFRLSRDMRPLLGRMVIAMPGVLGGLALYWSGSKSGWLIALATAAVALARMPRFRRYRLAAMGGVLAIGLALFAVRFSGYFSRGATSVSARLDYWKAAVTVTREHPLWGTGPGTFQRPYQKLKHPDAEMARLVHNDYLEQFSDSGVPGGVLFACWVGGALVLGWRRQDGDPVSEATALGVSAWLAQGVAEFGLYLPGLAWAGFLLLGLLAGSDRAPGIASTPDRAEGTLPGSQ